jgi:cobalt-zinc-cadmium resistance protein CzcA
MKMPDNKNKLSLYRISASAVNYVINTAIGGIPISEIYEEERKFEILVKYSPEFRETVSKLSLLPVFNEVGEAIPLGQLCEIKVDDGETIIFRSNGNRRITVRTDIRNRAQNDFVKEAKDRINPYLKNWEGIEINWLGMFENLSRAKNHFGLLIPLSLLIIFFLLFIFYESYPLALLIIFTVPLSTIGSFYALALRDYQLSVSAGVGFTTLFGIASMHGILLVSHISNLKNKGMGIRESVIQGASSRFRPVLMTASVAFIGLLPASLSSEIGSDIQRPIATVMIYGIITSAFLTLFLIPVLYEYLEDYNYKKLIGK